MSADRDRAALVVPIWLERTSAWAQRLLIIGLALGALLWLALQTRVALVPFLIAMLVASALRPVAARLERVGAPRSVAAATVILGVGAILGVVGWFIYAQTSGTLNDGSFTEEEIRADAEEWLGADPFNLSTEQIDDAERSIRDWVSRGASSFGVEEATLAVQVVGGALLALVLTFFLVKDGPSMWAATVKRINPIRRDAIARSGAAVTETLSAYLRSVVITGFADALLIGLGLWVLGVPLVVPLMLLTAIAALFPLVGAVVAGAAAALVALAAEGPSTALWVIVLTLVVQQVEGNVLQPLIVSRRVSIHPVVVLVSLATGGAVAGLAGAFLAVPIVAASISAIRSFSAEFDVTDEDADADAASNTDPESDPEAETGPSAHAPEDPSP